VNSAHFSVRPPSRRTLILVFIALAVSGCATKTNRDGAEYVPAADRPNSKGLTPLEAAADAGNAAQMDALLKGGAGVDALDRDGDTALCHLVREAPPRLDCVDLLLKRGANPNRTNRVGRTPIQVAANLECGPADADSLAKLYTILVAAGADANLPGPSGELPLHTASYKGQPAQDLDVLLHATHEPHSLSGTGLDAYSEAARGDRRDADLHLAEIGFVPQSLTPVATGKDDYSALPDNTFSLTARAELAYGDYLAARGLPGAAGHYRTSADNFALATAVYKRAVAQMNASLDAAKDTRDKKIAATVALDVLGVGLAAVTGVGFVAFPRHFSSDTSYVAFELKAAKAELGVLTREGAEVEAKARALGPPLPPAPALPAKA
jgi:hypothetical protein